MERMHVLPTKLYHLSVDNHDGEIFKPRIPSNTMDNENRTKKRICFSTSLSGAYRALSNDCLETLFVHIPIFKENCKKRVYKPSTKEVPDVKATREKWVRQDVRMKCVGVVKISHNMHKFKFKNDEAVYNYVNVRWLKRY